MRLHLGCGPNRLEGWINVDRYVDHPEVEQYDLLELPYPDDSVDEILSEHVFEHFGFADEERLWRGCHRVLKPGGVLTVETPDLEWSCRTFLEVQDNFQAFYQVGAVQHYFGQDSPATDNRWSLLTTTFFGNQNGPGQFHRNGYTVGKFRAIADLVGFASCEVRTLYSKGGQSIRGRFVK